METKNKMKIERNKNSLNDGRKCKSQKWYVKNNEMVKKIVF